MSGPPKDILKGFSIPGCVQDIQAYGKGHIHDTYLVQFDQNRQYIFQRFNSNVFPQPGLVTENILAVSEHLKHRLRLSGLEDWQRRVLTLVSARDGQRIMKASNGEIWRVFAFIPGTVTLHEVRSADQAFAFGNSFGRFQVQLSDFTGDLHTTIPHFHDTRQRFTTFEASIPAAASDRLVRATESINFAQARRAIVDVLNRHIATGKIPTRVAHNDAKIHNLLFDEETQEGICVIDLDTVMPGTPLYDFGDMVRSGTTTAPENERSLNKIALDIDLFSALAEGYLHAARSMLTEAEKDLLVFSGILLTFESGLRFLTDYLQGDAYFKIDYPEQNIDRCQNQFRLVEILEQQEALLAAHVEKIWSAPDQTEVRGAADSF